MTGGSRFEGALRPPQEANDAHVTAVDSVRHEVDLARVTVVATGELDIVSVDDLEAVMRRALESGCRHLVLDLRELTFIDSQGLHLMMRWSRLADRCGIAFTIIKGGPAIQRVFEIVGLRDRLRFVDAIEDGSAVSAQRPLATGKQREAAKPAIRLWTRSRHDASPQADDAGV